MEVVELEGADREVLAAIGRLADRHAAAHMTSIAVIARTDTLVVQQAVNHLFEQGLITPNLVLTDKGREVLQAT